MSRLTEIYAEVPDVGCKGLCWNHCTTISLFAAERTALELATGRPVIGEHFEASEQGPELTIIGANGPCPHLSASHRCSVYEHRPIICRVFGAADGLPCPHGCKPPKPMADEQTFDLFNRVEALGR